MGNLFYKYFVANKRSLQSAFIIVNINKKKSYWSGGIRMFRNEIFADYRQWDKSHVSFITNSIKIIEEKMFF